MTFHEAALVAVTNKLHIRRKSWPADKWFYKVGNTPYGPHWYVFILSGTEKERNGTQTVRCSDYNADDLRATDWTTVPAPLMACPITPTEPGGGGPPGPGFPGFPSDPPPGFPSTPGVPSGGGGGGGPSLPPPDPGTYIKVKFEGITDSQPNTDDDPAIYYDGLKLNDTWTLNYVGPSHFRKEAVQVGYYKHPHVDEQLKIYWDIDVTRTEAGLYSVLLSINTTESETLFVAGGFLTISGTEKARRNPITNGVTNPLTDGVMVGGFATVL